MPASTVRSFTDPDDYAASVRATTADLTIVARGRFAAKLTRIDLRCLSIGRFSDNLPRVAHVEVLTERANFSFRTQPGPSLITSGLELRQSDVLQRGAANDYFQRSTGPADFGSVSLPVEELVSVGAEIAGCDLTPPTDALAVTPPPAALARLQHLHAAAGTLAEDAPAVIANPAAAHGLEQALIGALTECLGAGHANEDRSALRQHVRIMRRFHQAIGDRLDQPLYVAELCTAIGVSERTLRMCCQEQLGVGPRRYLMLRRMHLARRRLRESSADATSVTEIATQYGFWQFGRFAGEYKSLFGESPSVTLGCPREHRQRSAVL
jgi:AraC-like DNA-binding protein